VSRSLDAAAFNSHATAGSRAALREALETAVHGLSPTPDLLALLEQPLPTKALTLMRLSPGTRGDLWTQLPNPLGGVGRGGN
jgi:DNA polymerase-3 subunit chi